MLELYDVVIMMSIVGLSGLYAMTVFVIMYTISTHKILKCTEWLLIPNFLINFLNESWEKLDKNPREVILLLVIVPLGIIPFSLAWILSYPLFMYYVTKTNKCCESY